MYSLQEALKLVDDAITSLRKVAVDKRADKRIIRKGKVELVMNIGNVTLTGAIGYANISIDYEKITDEELEQIISRVNKNGLRHENFEELPSVDEIRKRLSTEGELELIGINYTEYYIKSIDNELYIRTNQYFSYDMNSDSKYDTISIILLRAIAKIPRDNKVFDIYEQLRIHVSKNISKIIMRFYF